MRVIGTAGHVDHGKSTLIQALTGTHPDRLKEEQEREMTIDLGFAWLTLPDDEEVGVVDVPGHQDFIENMLAGVGGIDAALFVVAADEGVMPQTREHLAILDLLQIPGGIIALTKIDMVDDPDWIDLIEEDLRGVLAGSVLENAPIVRVSARKGVGIDDLRATLTDYLQHQPRRIDYQRPRLPIDRVFTLSGFGTIVTGTLSDGIFRVGDEVETLPGGQRGRIRGLQSHKRKEQQAVPGSRTAVNISGVDLDEVHRGEWLAHTGRYQATRRLDLHFRMLADSTLPLKHNAEVKFFIGAAQVVGRVRVLGTDMIAPGETGWVQIELREEVVALRGDHYILRRPSPSETIGGGIVVDPRPGKRHKRFNKDLLSRLETLLQGTPEDLLLQAFNQLGVTTLAAAREKAKLAKDEAFATLDALLADGRLLPITGGDARTQPKTLLASQTVWTQQRERVTRILREYHAEFPLRRGISREELKSRLRFDASLFNATLAAMATGDEIVENGAEVWLAGHTITLTPAQERAVQNALKLFSAAPYAPPSVKELKAQIGDDVFNAMIALEMLVSVSPDVVFRTEDYTSMREQTRTLLQTSGDIKVSTFRDHFRTTRKYALAFLEHLDAVGVTVREGDIRRLR